MPARTGQEYITGLKERPREVWLNGERVKDVTEHPALRNGVRSVAALYDMQHDPALREVMTFASPSTGDPVGLSFLIPKTIDDLVRRREMMTRWAWASCGMMGRSPDFMNSIFSAWAGSAGYYAQDRPEFKRNMLNYHEFIRENDVTLTHALVNLQRRRHQGPTDILHEDVALTMVKETDAGIVVKGSRTLATLGPISDEIAIYPVASHRLDDEAKRQTFSFSIPCDTPGVKFLCRESFDYGRSHFNHPLSSRFEEMDTVVFFDNVLVPWERIFLLGNVELGNGYAAGTQSDAHTGHQILNRCLVKSEFLLGLADLIVDTLGSGSIPHVQEQVAELITYRDVLRACVRAAEADATPQPVRHDVPRRQRHTRRTHCLRPFHVPAHGGDNPATRYRRPDGPARRGRLRLGHRGGNRALLRHRLHRCPRPCPAVPPSLGRIVQRLQRTAGTLRADVWREPGA